MFARESRISRVDNPLGSSVQWFRETMQLKNVRTSNGVLEVWFHGLITRTQAEDLLEGRSVGSFLLRVSQTRFGYSLSFKGKTRCYHVAVELRGSLYIVIGDNRASFRSLRDLIIFYKRHPVVEEGYVLTDAVGQEDNTCDYQELVEEMTEITLTPTRTGQRPSSLEVAEEATQSPIPSPTYTTPVIMSHSLTDTTPVPAVERSTPVKSAPVKPRRTTIISRDWEENENNNTSRQEIIDWFRRTQMSPLMKKQGGFYPWFYGILSRSKSELMLKNNSPGCFFVRVCDDQCMLCLSMKGSRGKVKHFEIACLPNKKYQVIGELKDFRNMNNLIQYYKMYPISAFGDKLKEVGCGEGYASDFTELLNGSSDSGHS